MLQQLPEYAKLQWEGCIGEFVDSLYTTQQLLATAKLADVRIRLAGYNSLGGHNNNAVHLCTNGVFLNNVEHSKDDMHKQLAESIEFYWSDVTDDQAFAGLDADSCYIEFPDFKIEYNEAEFELCTDNKELAKPIFEQLDSLNRAFNKVVKVYWDLF